MAHMNLNLLYHVAINQIMVWDGIDGSIQITLFIFSLTDVTINKISKMIHIICPINYVVLKMGNTNNSLLRVTD